MVPLTRTVRGRAEIFLLLQILVALCLVAMPAMAHAQQTPSAPSATAETHLGKGYEALKQEQYDLAINEFRAALEIDPTLVLRARFPLAVALFESHKADEARHELERVRNETGEHPNVSYYLGRLDLEQRNFSAAIHNLTEASTKPPFPDTTYYLGYAYYQQGDLKSAERWLKQAAEANPRDARVQYQLGMVYHKAGRELEAAQAVALSKDLRQHDNRISQLRIECGQKLDQGSRDAARQTCDLLYDPDNADALTELGTIYGQHGDAEDALKPLRRAAELSPRSPQTQYNLAMAYYQLNRFQEARVPLAAAVQHWPDLFPLNMLYGAVLLKLNEETAAYDVLHHAHELNPQDRGATDMLYVAAAQLAVARQASKQYKDSLRYWTEAAKLRPQESEPHSRMAEIYGATGQAAQSKAQEQEAARLAQNGGR
jgi:tetratricopeptide (TPR) repeat protein